MKFELGNKFQGLTYSYYIKEFESELSEFSQIPDLKKKREGIEEVIETDVYLIKTKKEILIQLLGEVCNEIKENRSFFQGVFKKIDKGYIDRITSLSQYHLAQVVDYTLDFYFNPELLKKRFESSYKKIQPNLNKLFDYYPNTNAIHEEFNSKYIELYEAANKYHNLKNQIRAIRTVVISFGDNYQSNEMLKAGNKSPKNLTGYEILTDSKNYMLTKTQFKKELPFLDPDEIQSIALSKSLIYKKYWYLRDIFEYQVEPALDNIKEWLLEDLDLTKEEVKEKFSVNLNEDNFKRNSTQKTNRHFFSK